MKKNLRFEFLVLDSAMPSTRFRVLQYLPYLTERRIRFKVFSMKPQWTVRGFNKLANLFHYLRVIAPSWRYDLVFVQKPGFIIHRWLYLHLLFRLARRVVFDFDDAIFINRDQGRLQSEALLKKLEFIFRQSRLIVAGNSYLGEFAKKYNHRVAIVPTPVDSTLYRPRGNMHASPYVTVGWMGTALNLAHMIALLPVIKEVLVTADVRFLIISNCREKPAEFVGIEGIEFRAWQAATEVEDLQDFDIGLMPLADDLYTRGKCGFKLLQYMAVGLPVLASPVGMNCRIVEEGINGFLADGQKEWLEKLRQLCRDGELRQRLGRAGRQRIEEEFSLKKVSGTWLELLQMVAAEQTSHR